MKNKTNKVLKFSIIFVLLLMILHFVYIFSLTKLNFHLNGEKYVKLNLKDKYKEEKATAKIFNKNLNDKIEIKNNIKENKDGIYDIKYTLKLPLNKKVVLKRIVEVINNEAPTIALNGNPEVTIKAGDPYTEEGANAKDAKGHNLNPAIVIEGNVDTNKPGKYVINYKIEDGFGKTSSVSRTVVVNPNPQEIAPIPNAHAYTPSTYDKSFNFKNFDVAIGYYNLVTGKQFLYNENKVYYGASLVKTVDALYLAEHNMINSETRPLVRKAISVSDNPSHKALVRIIGFDNLRNFGHKIGAKHFLNNGPGDSYADTTVMDQLAILKRLYPVVNKNSELKSYFTNSFYNYLKINNSQTLHKYGALDSYFHDVGIIYDKEPYIIVILSKGVPNTKYNFNQIAHFVHNMHKGK